jgi:TolB protein
VTKGRYYSGVIAAVAVLAAFACGCGGQDAVDPSGSLVSEEGQIAFTRVTKFNDTDIESDIYISKLDGLEQRRLTNSPGLDGFSAWSPDGRRIVFTSDRNSGNWELYFMNSDGTEQKRLTNTSEDEDVPAWSPDGKKIAYVVDPLGEPTIHVMNADGSNQRRLVDGSWPSWSPDGERLAYTDFSVGEERLAVMNADGSQQRRVPISLVRHLTGAAAAYEAAWSPDGKRFAYVAAPRTNNEEIYVMNVDGSHRHRLTDIPGNDHWPPTWSPDGTRIAFTSDGTDGSSEIYVMNSDGSGLTKLTDGPDDTFPAWRPRVR